MQFNDKSVFLKKNALFIRFKLEFNSKKVVKYKKYVILLIVKELLFHDEKTKSAYFFKTKCTICQVFIIGWQFICQFDIYNERL